MKNSKYLMNFKYLQQLWEWLLEATLYPLILAASIFCVVSVLSVLL